MHLSPSRRLPPAGLASRFRRLLDPLRRLARAELRGGSASRVRFLQTRAQRLHQIDDLAAALRCNLRHRDLLALDLLLNRRLDARPDLVRISGGLESLGGLLINELA